MDQTPTSIAGATVTAEAVLTIRSPADGSVVATVPALDAAAVDRACASAQTALARDDFPQHQRARTLEVAARHCPLLLSIVDILQSTAVVVETGRPPVDARIRRCSTGRVRAHHPSSVIRTRTWRSGERCRGLVPPAEHRQPASNTAG